MRKLWESEIKTSLSGDLYRGDIVFVDIDEDFDEDTLAKALSEEWSIQEKCCDINLWKTLGIPSFDTDLEKRRMIENNRLRQKVRIIKKGDSISDDEIKNILEAIKQGIANRS